MQGRRFFPGTPVSPTNKTDRHDIIEILLKVALNNFLCHLKEKIFIFELYTQLFLNFHF
jgi:hypothetical protein